MSLKGRAEERTVIRGSVRTLKIIDGKSAYDIAVLEGFVGTKKEWLESLKGKDFKYSDFTAEQLAELKGGITAEAEAAAKRAETAAESAEETEQKIREVLSEYITDIDTLVGEGV